VRVEPYATRATYTHELSFDVQVMAAMCAWNDVGAQTSYAGDDATRLVVERLTDVFETEVRRAVQCSSPWPHA
jgi:hypothetical protein